MATRSMARGRARARARARTRENSAFRDASSRLLFLFFLAACRGGGGVAALPADIERDARLSVPELITVYGYPAETHTVETEDGYILTLHRIPHGVWSSRVGPPVLLMHGLLCSSADWVVMGPDKGFGYLLADAGFDVWMGNFRGNKYSKRHVLYPSSSDAYWNFSWQENGVYDLPAMIDYVLYQTYNNDLLYAGHSMGSTSFFVMTSIRPEYNYKVRVMCSMAPVSFMGNMQSPLLRQLAFSTRDKEWLLQAMGVNEFAPNNEIRNMANRNLCNDQALTQEMCSNILFLIAGWDSQQLNRTMLPVILSHFPAGAATKQILHYAQEVVSNRFCEYDYGNSTSNMYVYGTPLPPAYNVSDITTPIVVFYSDNDWLCSVTDSIRLYKLLGNPVSMIRVPFEKFNHLDYLWAIDAKSLVYDTIMDVFSEYS